MIGDKCWKKFNNKEDIKENQIKKNDNNSSINNKLSNRKQKSNNFKPFIS